MFNATQTYKDRLIKKIQSLKNRRAHSEWNDALQTVIDVIRLNTIEPVVDKPHKVKTCKH